MTPFFRLHSGGVVRNGHGVLFVGPSGAGKTTLVVRLVSEGFALLSDDEVWIDPASRHLHPSPRRCLLKDSSRDLFPAHRHKLRQGDDQGGFWWLDPEDIRPNCRAAPSPVWGMVCLGPRRTRPVLEPIGQTAALTTALGESMNFPECRADGLSLLVELVKSARLFRLHTGDLDECARLLTAALP